MIVVLDSDIASIFAKIDDFTLLRKLFPKSKFCIVPEVVTELKKTEDLGYDWATIVFDNTNVLGLTDKELKRYEGLINELVGLDPGEIQSIILCENRNAILLTNDKRAVDYASKKKIKVLDLSTLLFSLKEQHICDKDELEKVIGNIEEKDHLVLKGKERILE